MSESQINISLNKMERIPVKYHCRAMTTLKYLIMRKRMNKPYATLEDMLAFSPYLGKKQDVLANLRRLAKYNFVVIKDKKQFAVTPLGEKVPTIVTSKHREELRRRGKLEELSGDE
jgi:hypothetical protein